MEYRLTYGMLLEQLKTLSPEQLKMDVVTFCVYNREINQMVNFDITGEEDPDTDTDAFPSSGVIKAGYPYLVC